MDSKGLALKIEMGFATTAYVALHFYRLDPEYIDADDYIETMILAESLKARGTFDARDFVERMRTGRRTVIDGQEVPASGKADARSQSAKLRASRDPYYVASDGITTGAAMRVFPVAAFFPDFEEMVYAAHAQARITHASCESRLVAVLAAIAYRNALIGRDSIDDLETDFDRACRLLWHDGIEGSYVRDRLATGRRAVYSAESPGVVHHCLSRRLGLLHVATSGGLAAVLWSYLGMPVTFLERTGPGKLVSEYTLDPGEREAMLRHYNGQPGTPEEWAMRESQDADTFLSIGLSIAAVRHPDRLGRHLHRQAETGFFESWSEIADAFARRWGV